MKVYLAGAESATFLSDEELADHRWLFSFASGESRPLKKCFLMQDRGYDLDLFMDSGAFSAANQGKSVDLDVYIEWLQTNGERFTVYAPLDVIGDSKASERNFHYMESFGLSPLPVFHYGSDMGLFREMVAEYSYIALGGLVPLRGSRELDRFVGRCFSIARDDVRLHGFGYSDFQRLKRFPFYSIDATTWNVGSRFAHMLELRDGVPVQVPTYMHKNPRYERLLLSDRMRPDDGSKQRCRHNINAIKEGERFLTKLWCERGIDWDQWEEQHLGSGNA